MSNTDTPGDLGAIEGARWWFSGKVSEIAVEDYDSLTDAVGFPVVYALFATAALYLAALPPAGNTSVTQTAVTIVFAVLGALAVVLFSASVVATTIYVREWLPPTPEVVDR